MKRLFISIFILIMITGLSVCCLDSLDEDCEKLTEKLSEISASAVNDRVPEKLLTELDALWANFSFRGSMQLDSQSIDELGAELSRLRELSALGSEEVRSQAIYLSTSVSTLCKRQHPRIESLL